MDKVSCYQLKHYNFFIPTFAFSSSFLVAIQKGTFLSMWTFGHISLWVYCRLLSGWVDMFSMPTKVTYQIVLLLRLLVWKHDNLHIGVKVVNTKYLQNTLFSLKTNIALKSSLTTKVNSFITYLLIWVMCITWCT